MSFKKGEFAGEKHPNWKGGKPKCKKCGKQLTYNSLHCKKHRIFSEEWLEKVRLGTKKRSNEKHYLWKGDSAGYRAKHRWIERRLGKPTQCVKCKKNFIGRDIQWANISGKYKRNINDWKRMCRWCHSKMDAIKRHKLKTM